MNTLSIPVVAMASISLYVGFHHLLIYFRRRQIREDLTFALLCFAIVFYDAFSVGLYNSVSTTEGAGWQRAQFITLAIFVPVFLWFVSDYTHQRPGTPTYLFSLFYSFAAIIQLVDRSSLTFLVDQPSIKHVNLFSLQPIIYYEVALGPVSTLQSLMGIVASTYILILGIQYFRRGYKQEAIPLIFAIGLMYAAGIHDTLVSNGVYDFIYLIEYSYLAVILVMTFSLSNAVVDSAVAKEQLKKSEERFRALVETTSDWVWEVDANGVYTYASPKIRDLLGYDPEEILGRTPFALMPPEEAERVRPMFQNAMLHKQPIESMENVVIRKDGRLIVLETSGVPFFDDRGRLLGYRGIDRDITERKQAEAQIERALRETRVRFEVSQALASAETEDDVLDILIRCTSLYPQTFVAILTFDRIGNELIAIVRRQDTFESGLTASMSMGDSLPASRYTLFEHFFADKPFVSENISTDERFEPAGREILEQTGVASFAAIPLTVGNEWMGYIGVMARPVGYFDDEKLHLYQTLAEQGAVALRAARLRETIRESQQRLSLLVQQSPLAVIEWNMDLKVVSWNPAAERMFGYSREAALGRHASFIVSAESRPLFDQVWQVLLAQKTDIHLDNENLTKDGRSITCEWFNAPLVGTDGQVIGIVSLVQDITERQRAEETIKNERQRFQTILETVRVPTVISRISDGKVLYGNQALVQVSQVDLNKLIGFKTSSFYANPDDRNVVIETLKAYGHIDDHEVQFRRTDGSLYWALLSSRVLEYDGEPCVLSTYIDITERKHAEQALQAKTEELDRYFTSSLDLLCIADTDGYFRRLNPEWEKTLGYPIAELEGRQFLELVHPEDVEATVATISQLKDQQQILNFENRYRCKDGSYRWIEWRSYPMGRMIYAVARDITERKQIEEALRESEQKFRLFIEQSSDGLVFTDEHGIIIEWNQAQERLTGLSRQESIGRPLWDIQLDLLPVSKQGPGQRKELEQRTLLALQSGQADFLDKPMEIALSRRDRVQVIVQQVTFSIKTSQGYRLGSISRDITPLKQAEEELKTSEERYRQLVEVSPTATWIAKDDIITYVNPAALQVLGTTEPGKILGRPVFDFIHPDYHSVVKERVLQMREQGKIAPLMEEKYLRLDGSSADVEVMATPFLASGGAVIQVFFQDITKRKQAEKALQESEERHRALVESQVDLISRYLPDTTLTFVNDAYCKFYGKTRDELIGQSCLFMIAPEFREQVAREAKELAAANGTVTGEYINYRYDGKECWIQWVIKCITDENDRVVELQAVGRDITQIKQAEQALRESEERLRQIASSLRETIWLRDVQTRQVLYVNPAFEELTGWTCESFYEKPDIVMNAIHPDDKEWVIKALARRYEDVLYNVEHRIIHRDGSVRWVSSRSFPVRDEAGEVYRWASIMEDITERKHAEAERERLIAELESKNAELERFTYTVSHDLKAPLITIRGFLGFIEKDAQIGNVDRLKEDVQRISAATDKMQRLLNELLELSRIGRLMNLPQNIPFRALIDDVIKLMEGQLRERGVEVIIQNDLPVVSGDPQRLFEVLQNLVDNAVKFVDNSTKPVIEIGSCGEEKDMPILYVRDNGIGIAREHHHRIFGLFNKLDPKAEGTGVGLAIVKRIIDLHGGRIWVESQLGHGTTFYFTLPGGHPPAARG